MCKPLADPVFDIGRDLQIAYDEGYRKGRYDEKVYLADCISRQEAIKVASGYCHPANIADELRKLPPAQPMRWIPCSERLPTKAGHYLCSFNKPNRIDNIYVDLAYWTGGRWYGYLANEINAWMPLPEPYGGEQNE